MQRFLLFVAILMSFSILLSGCYLNDSNHNDKIRYSMAHEHARRALEQAGSQLRPYDPDYELEIFWRYHWDDQVSVMHTYQLYDFLKTSKEPGPDRFVIAYDKATRETYLRSNLRSNENLDSLPASQP